MADAFTSETYNALCRDAEGYLARGLAEQARELLLKATSLIGTRARARSLLADACMQLTLWGEAKSQLEALATLEVDNIHTHFRLGQVLEETGEYQLAMDNFRVVLDMNPDHHGAKVSISRLEMVSKEQPPSKIPSVVEGQQIYADSGDGGVFSEDSGSIDELLNTIGMGEKKEVDGVEDLLNSIGMNNEEKKKAKVDFDSIFGTPPQGEGTADDTPLSDVFSQDQPDQPASSESSSLDSIFGGDAPPASDTETEPPAADLGAMFGGGESVAESTEADADIPEAVPETNLDSIFGGDESPETEAYSEPPAVEEPPAEATETDSESPVVEPLAASLGAAFGEEEPVAESTDVAPETDLDSIFGGDESPETEAYSEPPAVEEPPAEATETDSESPVVEPLAASLGAAFGEEEPVAESTETVPETNLDFIFGGDESPETEADSEPPAVEEPPAEATETDSESPVVEPLAASLGAAFGEEEPVAESTDVAPETDLDSIFGGDESPETEADSEPPAVEEPPAEATETDSESPVVEPLAASLGAAFGEEEPVAEGSETDVAPEEEAPPTEESEVESESGDETSPESTPEDGSVGDDISLEEEPPPAEEEEDKKAESNTEEPPAEISVVVPVVPEETVNEPAEESAEAEELPPEPEKELLEVPLETSTFTLLPGDDTSLCVLNLEDSKARVTRGLVVAMEGSVSLDGDVISGNGLVWMGQGSLTPVVVDYKEGMTIRIDRVAARPVQIAHEACGIGSVPSLCKFSGNADDDSILMFVSGRLKKLTVTSGLRVRGGSVVSADPEVSFSEGEAGFLSVSGSGEVIITG